MSWLLLQRWLSKGFGWTRANNLVWAQHGMFHDQLVADLGVTHILRRCNPVTEWFGYVKNEVRCSPARLNPIKEYDNKKYFYNF
jgi:hypothetical protein